MARVLTPLLFVALLGVQVAAVDLTGDWTLELNPDFGGTDDTVGCVFKQDGAALTANCGGAAVSGSVDGQTVTLRVTTGAKGELTATFIGTLDQSGGKITGTWQLGERSGNFTAIKR